MGDKQEKRVVYERCKGIASTEILFRSSGTHLGQKETVGKGYHGAQGSNSTLGPKRWETENGAPKDRGACEKELVREQ